MTNYEKIKNMSAEEMADMFEDIYQDEEEHEIRICGGWMPYTCVLDWLLSESEDNDD